MTIDKSHPNSVALKKLELRTFTYLRTSPTVNSNFRQLARDAAMQADALSSRLNRGDVNFESVFDIDARRQRYRFHIGTIIKHNYSLVSYYIAICSFKKTTSKFNLKRKYHFDYDINGRINNHPVFHFQYAGEISRGLEKDYATSYDSIMYPKLSEPRLPYPPMTLSLILNQIFSEFKSDITARIIRDDKWNEVIKISEDAVLRPYYSQCKAFFDRGHSSKRLFMRDYCYGN